MIPLVQTNARERLNRIFSQSSGRKDDLIPLLQKAQEEFGYLPAEVMREIARFVKVPESIVYGAATFYAQFKFAPVGKKIIKVCRGTACHVRGAPRILDEVEKVLGIKPGQTTDDMEYSLETIACFGSCALAPVMVVNDAVYGRMTPRKVAQILGVKEKASTELSRTEKVEA